MRGFFVLLLITNVLFLGWQLWFEAESKVVAPLGGMLPVSEGLQLFSELEEGKLPPQRKLVPVEEKFAEASKPEMELITVESAVEDKAKATSPPLIDALCYQSIPLVTVNDAKALQKSLASIGISETKLEAIQIQKINYWVMLNAYKNRAKANEAADILKQKRVKDFFIVRSGRYENAVSLGVYSTRERAEKRYKEIAGLKLRLRKPVIEAKELPAKRLIVSFTLVDGIIPDGLSSMLESSNEPQLQKKSCN